MVRGQGSGVGGQIAMGVGFRPHEPCHQGDLRHEADRSVAEESNNRIVRGGDLCDSWSHPKDATREAGSHLLITPQGCKMIAAGPQDAPERDASSSACAAPCPVKGSMMRRVAEELMGPAPRCGSDPTC